MPHDVRIVTESDLRMAVGLSVEVVDVVERAFIALAARAVKEGWTPGCLSAEAFNQRVEQEIEREED